MTAFTKSVGRSLSASIARVVRDGVIAVCEEIAAHSYFRIFETDGDPYLSRFRLLQIGDVTVQLHKFHRGDRNQELHNHPWRWAVSLILAGGYREERKIGESSGANVWTRFCRPGSINVLRGDTYHRVDLLDPDAGCWTLFISGPKSQTWSFWDRKTGQYTPWRDFLALEAELRRVRREAVLGGVT